MRKIVAAALLTCVLAAVGIYLRSKPGPTMSTPAAAVSDSLTTPSRTSPPARAAVTTARITNAVGTTAGTSAPAATAQFTPGTSTTPQTPVTGPLLFGGPESAPVNLPGETVLENVRSTLRNYGSMFDGNPVGTNPEITAALDGDNPKGVHFLDAEKGMRLNSKGELVDPWGTPYFFHQLSGTETEIRSAGPDKQMWTADDLVIK